MTHKPTRRIAKVAGMTVIAVVLVAFLVWFVLFASEPDEGLMADE